MKALVAALLLSAAAAAGEADGDRTSPGPAGAWPQADFDGEAAVGQLRKNQHICYAGEAPEGRPMHADAITTACQDASTLIRQLLDNGWCEIREEGRWRRCVHRQAAAAVSEEFRATVDRFVEADSACHDRRNHDGEQLSALQSRWACMDTIKFMQILYENGYCSDRSRREWFRCGAATGAAGLR